MDRPALDDLTATLYSELRGLAQKTLAGERSNSALQPTVVVHEVYLRLRQRKCLPPELSRTEFLAVAAKTMRWVLIDEARKQHVRKAVGPQATTIAVNWHREPVDILAFDELLGSLGKLSARMREVVELRVFGGLTVAEAAIHLGVSERTIKGDWAMARAWLRQELAR